MEEIEAFLAVIETGSQTAAARRLGRSVQAVNRSLLALEHGVGVELVRRTTRNPSPPKQPLRSIGASSQRSPRSARRAWKRRADAPSHLLTPGYNLFQGQA
jgi:DNA-binding transcriptional LysR family regulator